MPLFMGKNQHFDPLKSFYICLKIGDTMDTTCLMIQTFNESIKWLVAVGNLVIESRMTIGVGVAK
jgi:hypothetical protein